MAKCGYCAKTIAFGGVKEGDRLFCGKGCRDKAYLAAAASQLPDEFVVAKAQELHAGPCPKCGGAGPVDVHVSHTVWSALVLTSRRSVPQVCCHPCGKKAKLGGAVSSAVFGWWGLPWGLIWTPVQIGRNVSGLFSKPDASGPSDLLVAMVRRQLSVQLIREEGAKAVAGVA